MRNSDNRRKIKIIIGIVIALVIGGYVLSSILQEHPLEYAEPRFIVPEKVSLRLYKSFIEKNVLTPILELSVYAGGGCDEVSELKITKKLNAEKNLLAVDIKGYYLKKYKGKGGCIAIVYKARAKLDIIELLEKNDEVQLLFHLNGKDNTYSLTQEQYAIYLEPLNAINVISHWMGENIPKTAKSIALITQTNKLVMLYLYGTYYADTDYNKKLREVAQSKGLMPADEVLKGFSNNRKDELYVVIPDSFKKGQGVPVIVGNITAKSAHGFVHSVDVAIKERRLTWDSYSY